MTLEALYSISDFHISDNSFEARLSIDPDHAVFKGHFPSQAVVPGVCLIRIVREMATRINGQNMSLKTGNNIKFLHLIDPAIDHKLALSGNIVSNDANGLVLNASIIAEDLTFFKFKGVFTIFVNKQP